MPISAAITAVGGLIGTSLTNSANRRIARETNNANIAMNNANNQLQRDLASEKYQKDLEQWHRENEYNTPLAQRQRLLQAGLNPALQNVDTGQASSSPEMALPTTTPGRAEMGAPADWSGVGNAISQSVNAYYQNQKLKAETDATLIDNQTRNLRNFAEYRRLNAQTRGELARASGQEIDNEFARRHNELDLQLKDSQIHNIKSQTELNFLEALRRNDELVQLPQRYQLELAQLAANVVLTRSNIDLARATFERTIKEIDGLDISNNQAKAISQYLIRREQFASYPSMDQLVNRQRFFEVAQDKGLGGYEVSLSRALGAVGGVARSFRQIYGR